MILGHRGEVLSTIWCERRGNRFLLKSQLLNNVHTSCIEEKTLRLHQSQDLLTGRLPRAENGAHGSPPRS